MQPEVKEQLETEGASPQAVSETDMHYQEVLSALEARLGMPLTPLVGGADGRTFAGDSRVLKVFAPPTPQTPSWQPGG
ncbi:hypothetical protein OFC00_31370, partial [Escherichia coli]|nr:hypothetical protein [Escherichia coli]